MKWKKTQLGDIRVVKKFALFPTHITDEAVYVWLQSYYIKQEFTETHLWSEFTNGYNIYNYWDTIEMSTKEITL